MVRRWCEAMGLKVERLARLCYGPVRLGDLPPGRYRPLTPKEEADIYKAIQCSSTNLGARDRRPQSDSQSGES